MTTSPIEKTLSYQGDSSISPQNNFCPQNIDISKPTFKNTTTNIDIDNHTITSPSLDPISYDSDSSESLIYPDHCPHDIITTIATHPQGYYPDDFFLEEPIPLEFMGHHDTSMPISPTLLSHGQLDHSLTLSSHHTNIHPTILDIPYINLSNTTNQTPAIEDYFDDITKS